MPDKEQILYCMDYPVYTGKLNEIVFDSKKVINTINQYSFCIAERDSEFQAALKQSDVLLPDGVAIVLAASLLHGKKIQKIAGADIHQYLLEYYNAKGGSCFYLGSSEKTLEKIEQHLKVDYPSLKAGFYSPPYKAKFSDEDNAMMIDAVNKFKPDVLFIGMTAPKQEKWVAEHKNQLNAGAICSIGAVFDFYAKTVKRPGEIWISLGLEWLGRLLKEPKRMSKRYLLYGPEFLFIVFNEAIKMRFQQKKNIEIK